MPQRHSPFASNGHHDYSIELLHSSFFGDDFLDNRDTGDLVVASIPVALNGF